MLRPLALATLLSLAACTPQRRITITSDPPGARVWLNDTEIGVTPASAAFKFYGAYDVRLELPGYEPLHVAKRANAPIQEQPGIDFLALLLPFEKKHEVTWHFPLTPSLEQTQTPEALESGLIDRARAMRSQLGETKSADQ